MILSTNGVGSELQMVVRGHVVLDMTFPGILHPTLQKYLGVDQNVQHHVLKPTSGEHAETCGRNCWGKSIGKGCQHDGCECFIPKRTQPCWFEGDVVLLDGAIR